MGNSESVISPGTGYLHVRRFEDNKIPSELTSPQGIGKVSIDKKSVIDDDYMTLNLNTITSREHT